MVFTNNMGVWLHGLFPANDTVLLTIVNGMIDITGTPQPIQVKMVFNNNNAFNRTMANFVQIGKGSTPTNRTDINIESPFSNGGAEDLRTPAGIGGFVNNTSKILIPTLINPTAGAGDIREICYFVQMKNSSGVDKIFLMWRNVIPLVGFIAGQSISIDTEFFV